MGTNEPTLTSNFKQFLTTQDYQIKTSAIYYTFLGETPRHPKNNKLFLILADDKNLHTKTKDKLQTLDDKAT